MAYGHDQEESVLSLTIFTGQQKTGRRALGKRQMGVKWRGVNLWNNGNDMEQLNTKQAETNL